VTAIDLLRLFAVPVVGWAAWRDYRTRRVPARLWYPIGAIGAIALPGEAALAVGQPPALRLFLIRTVLSLGLLVPLAFVFVRLGAFGKADAKAMMALAVLFPTYPTFGVAGGTFPVVVSNVGVFSLTIVTNGVLVGACFPLAVAARNVLAGRASPLMFVARPVSRSALLSTHGKLVETANGATLSGLDLDALRMYLRWRGLSVADLCEHPDAFRRSSTLPEDPNPATDGAVDPDADPDPTDVSPGTFEGAPGEDPWGAEAFLDSIEDSAYGATPETLRDGLDVIAARETVWVSPGLPFLVPLFAGLLVALTYGDVLFSLMRVAGVIP
jgi:preflagellin peptidase FlaK